MSLLKNLVDRFYPSKHQHMLTIFGEFWSGKSTIVNTMHGVGNNTYGNIGFSEGPVRVPTSSGKILEFSMWDFGLGCGNVRAMGLLYSSFIARGDALIWVVDAAQPSYLEASKADLNVIVDAVEEARVKMGKEKKFPILLLANKQDLPNAMSVDQIRKEFSHFTSFHISMVLPTSGIKPYEESGLKHGMDWLQIFLENPSLISRPTPANAAEPEKPKYPKELTDKIEFWVNKLDKDVSDEEFLRLFDTFSLPSWDHYTHIRIAYLLLTTEGRQKGKDKIFDGLKAYIEQSAPSTGRAFHFSMTYFWIQIVHLGIQNVANRKDITPPAAQSSEKEKPVLSSEEKDQFAKFLLLNPYVADGTLWTNYYSIDCMMGGKARSEMVLPDMKPLPNLVVRDVVRV